MAIDIFFLGSDYYNASNSKMGTLYVQSSPFRYSRSSWGEVETMLQAGQKVNIRPATLQELAWAERELLTMYRIDLREWRKKRA